MLKNRLKRNVFDKKKFGLDWVIFFMGNFSWEGKTNPPSKLSQTFPGLIRSFAVKENHIGPAVSKILSSVPLIEN